MTADRLNQDRARTGADMAGTAEEWKARAEAAETREKMLRERLAAVVRAAEGERLAFKGTLWEELLRARAALKEQP